MPHAGRRDRRPARKPPVGVELLRLVPGYVSTEVDANLSFNVTASVARERQMTAAYKQRGVVPERVLIKLAIDERGYARTGSSYARVCSAT